MRSILLLLVAAIAGSPAVGGDAPVLVLKDARILSTAGGEIGVVPRGSVLIREGRIEAAGEAVPVPEGAEVIALPGRWVLPGFIDAHSHGGVRGETDETTSAVTEDLRLLDVFDPWDPEIERALASGVTAAALSPGDRNVVGGVVAVVKLVPGRVPARIVRERAAVKASVGRAVLGGPSSPRYPTATSGALELFRSWVAGASADPAAPSTRDLPVLLRADARSQAESALSILAEASRPAVLLGGAGLDDRAWRLLAPRCPVVLGPLDLAAPRRVLAAPATLEDLGTPIAFASSGERRDLLTTAVLAMRAGLSRKAALAALTEVPARIYGLEGRLGCISPGADADLTVWSGDPFTLASRLEMVLVDGRIAWRPAR
jgi:imidazolonepropionase-like amidohydrolase